MSSIRDHIVKINNEGRKVLSIFLTAGFPNLENFVNLAVGIIDSGADIIELGVPFSDPIADGKVIQQSSQRALASGVTLQKTLELASEIKMRRDIPLILMGYANPIIQYGKSEFNRDAVKSGIDGVIIPDLPIEEFGDFFRGFEEQIDKILLTTPTSDENRIKQIDEASSGFVYCVSVAGITGVRDKIEDLVVENINRTYKLINKNKMLIGFGISSKENIIQLAPYCDGFIVGSAVINSLTDHVEYEKSFELVRSMRDACDEK